MGEARGTGGTEENLEKQKLGGEFQIARCIREIEKYRPAREKKGKKVSKKALVLGVCCLREYKKIEGACGKQRAGGNRSRYGRTRYSIRCRSGWE